MINVNQANVENIEFCIALSKLKSGNVFAAIKTYKFGHYFILQ